MKLKSIFGVLLSLALMMGLLPGMSLTAYAAAPDLVVKGNTVNPESDSSGEGWSYDHASKTLTLDGFNYDGSVGTADANSAYPTYTYGIYINIAGVTVIVNDGTNSIGGKGIYSSKELTINVEEGATLSVNTSYNGIISNEALTITVDGTFEVSTEGGSGVLTYSSCLIQGKGTLNVIQSGDEVDGIEAEGNITISGSVNVTAEGGQYGICTTNGLLTLESTGEINAKGRTLWGMYSNGGINITNGNVTAEGGDAGIGQNGKLSGTWHPLVIGENAIVVATGGDGGAIYYNQESNGNYRKVQNAIPGVAWTNKQGTAGMQNIAVSSEGQPISNIYKKVEFPVSHTHNFTYSATSATITATCSADGCPLSNNKATLTIGAPPHTTYSDTNSRDAVLTDTNGIKGNAEVKYYLANEAGTDKTGNALTEAPVNAGKYWAEITLGSGSGAATAHVVYTVAKENPIANPPTPSATYGQTLADVALNNPTGNHNGTWSWEADTTTSVGNVGDNVFKATFTPQDTTNYNSVNNVDVTVTVGKAANPATVVNTVTVAKGGNTVNLAGKVTMNGATGDVTYVIDGDANGCSLDGSVLTSGENTGSVNVNVTVDADDNYEALAATPITVTISDKGTQTITASDVTATYGDTNKKIEAATDGNGEISYAVKDGSDDYIDVNAATGTLTIKKVPTDGKAYVVVTAAETQTYMQATKEVTVTINKANAVPATVTANNRTYDGTENPLVTVTGEATGGEMQYAFGTATEANESYNTSIPTTTDVGTYYVWYKAIGDESHSDSDAEVVTVTIKEKTEAHTHKIEYVEAKDPTCTEDGYEAHYECTICHEWYADDTGSVPLDKNEIMKKATGHKWDDGVITQEATYDETGIKTYTCSVCGETKEETIPVKTRRYSSNSDSSDSDSESSGGGSSGKSGSISQKSIDVNGNTVQTQPDSGAPLSDRGGNWGNQEHIWTYTKSDGSLAKGEWLNLEYDGHTYWYYFDDSTIMQTNWFDYNGSRYFLVPEMDGWRGRMATGWHMVDNKWYYFEPTIGANQGILYRGMTTPDGHTVGADGAWDGNGTTPVGAIHTGTTVTMN